MLFVQIFERKNKHKKMLFTEKSTSMLINYKHFLQTHRRMQNCISNNFKDAAIIRKTYYPHSILCTLHVLQIPIEDNNDRFYFTIYFTRWNGRFSVVWWQ